MKDNNFGEVYQVLNVLKDDSETNHQSLNSSINTKEEEEEKDDKVSY